MAEQQIVVVKKRKHKHEHHGGAWKVAYADFVTAMMALFIVLWLLSTSDDVKKAVSGYFNDPKGTGKLDGNDVAGQGSGLVLGPKDMGKLKEKIEEALKQLPQLQELKNQVQMTLTGEGLRIELLEGEKRGFFESGNATPTDIARKLLVSISAQVGALPNKVLIEGHTDSRPFTADAAYSNWELSAGRANAARRIMQASGLRANQVSQVRGYADQLLRVREQPHDPSNRRVSIVVQYESNAAAEGHTPVAKQGVSEGPGEHGKRTVEPAKGTDPAAKRQGGQEKAQVEPVKTASNHH